MMNSVEAFALLFVFYFVKRQTTRSKRLALHRERVKSRSRAAKRLLFRSRAQITALALATSLSVTEKVSRRLVWCIPK